MNIKLKNQGNIGRVAQVTRMLNPSTTGVPFFIFLFFCTTANGYTDNQLADAIRKSEGVWTYGIKTVKCETESACRKICLTTIKNNRKRFAKSEASKRNDFLSYLAAKYAPIGAGNDPKNLNKNWLNNVRYWLSKNGGTK